ncbi:MAG: phosphoglucosamine mutase [Clostridia bacterium]|nr:phosphoglucosamine mutase [Clostridia bacterium]
MGRLFGTDGARGIANTELTCSLALNLGKAAAAVLTGSSGKKPRILIGKDTRISGDMLESAIAAGLCSVGADVILLGVVPTPAVAFLVKKYGCDAAFMISASHNPFEYNGIKIFNGEGYKLPDETENEIEAIILDREGNVPICSGSALGKISFCDTAVTDYIEYLETTVDVDFKGLKVAVDCAYGSSSRTAKTLFSQFGCELSVINAKPNGININDNCGSTHLKSLSSFVKENGCDVGLAFDGDADRLLAVDENGEETDGDKIITICAKYLNEENKLKNKTAVVTVMSNIGFKKFCDAQGIKYETTDVGDRYVLELMREKGYNLGGEQSGHIIFTDYATTGDGQLTALQLLRIMKKSGKKLSELGAVMKTYPQITINVPVSDMGKAGFKYDREIQNAVKQAENVLADKGRVLVRVSGTEPLVRIMLEGENKQETEILAKEIAEVVRLKLI